MDFFKKIIFSMTVLVASAQAQPLNCRASYDNGGSVTEILLHETKNGYSGTWQNKVSVEVILSEQKANLSIGSLQDEVDFSLSTTHSLSVETPTELRAGFSHGTFSLTCSR